MKKKIALIATCVVLVAAIAVGGTLAWFTDSKEVANTVTFGNVKIALTEPTYPGNDNEGKITDVVPGSKITKDPTIENIGTNDCWVRAKLEVTVPESAGNVVPTYNIDTAKWTLGEDGYYYYKNQLVSKDKAILFDEVTIPSAWGNDTAGKDVKIIVKAEAMQIQDKNNGNEANNAALWQGVTAEKAV